MTASDLQAQIESINNPRDFERLVNAIFSTIHGDDYTATDYHGDKGCDGYIVSSKTLLAKHCFERPIPLKSSKVSEILRKARADLKKGVQLSGRLPISQWMFVTNYLIPTTVLATLKEEVKAQKFELICVGPSFIADKLLLNKHIFQDFPFLHVAEIDETLKGIKSALDNVVSNAQAKQLLGEQSAPNKAESSVKANIDSPTVVPTSTTKSISPDLKKLIDISNQKSNDELITTVKSIIYSTSDPAAILQGAHILVAWYSFSQKTLDDQLSFISLGIDASRRLNSLDSEAVLLAEKATLLSTRFVLMDLEGWGRIEMTNRTGLPVITSREKGEIVNKLKALNVEFNKDFKEAIDKAFDSNNYLAVSKVFSQIGHAAGQRGGHFEKLGVNERAQFEKRVCKGAFMYAKSIAVRAKDDAELARVLHNFANSLGFLGEKTEALSVVSKAIELAKGIDNDDILEQAVSLKNMIETRGGDE